MSSETAPPSYADLIPPAEDSDPEDVVTALEMALSFGTRGDLREALRWLRRAAEAADDAGRDTRSLALARTAAELANLLPATAPPPAAEPAEAAPSAPVAPQAVASEPEHGSPMPSVRPPPPSARHSSKPVPPSKPSAAPAPRSVSPKPRSVSPKPPSVSPKPPSATPAPPSVAPAPPVVAAPADLTPPPPSVTPRPPSSLAPAPVKAASKSLAPAKPSQAPRSVSPSATPAAPSVRPPKPTYATPQALLGNEGSQVIERLMREGRAETVSVKRSGRDPSLFVFRTGAPRGVGTRRALVILLDEDSDFFSGEPAEPAATFDLTRDRRV